MTAPAQWIRAFQRSRRCKVWIATDAGGRPIEQNGKLQARYRLEDGRTYSLSVSDCSSLDEPTSVLADDPRVAAMVSATTPRRTQTTKLGRNTASAEGGTASPSEGRLPASAPSAPRKTRAKRSSAVPGSEVVPPAASPPTGMVASSFVPAALGQVEPIQVWTDGAAKGNPGPAGCGVVLLHGARRRHLSKYLGVTTNNVAELTAIDVALGALRRTDLPVVLYTDSQYAIGVLTQGWKAKANTALVAALRDKIQAFRGLRMVWVRGHQQNAGNLWADWLANEAVAQRRDDDRIVDIPPHEPPPTVGAGAA